MKTNGMENLAEDRTLADAVRQAFDPGDVPAHLVSAIHDAAGPAWLEGRRLRRQRMHRWLSGLTSMAAALVILTFSATQYFDAPAPRARAADFQHLDRIMDLVSLSYPDETLTDDELLALGASAGAEATPASVVARIDRLIAFDEESYLAE